MKIAKNCIEYTLFLIFGIVLFQSIFFLLNLKISNITILLATAVWIAYRYFFCDCKKILKDTIIAIIIVWFGILLLNLYFTQFHETTYDGSYYHGNAIVEMLNGWNPFYEANNYEQTGVTIWADYYPKATWIFSAVMIKLFNHLSSGMIINTLVSIITACYIFLFLSERKINKIFCFIIAMAMFLNPITIEQMHTYYVDALLGNLVTLLLMMGIEIMEQYDWRKNVLILLVSVIMINIKFTGFGFAGIINLFIWIYFLIKDRRNALNYMYFGIAMVLIAVLVIGFSPYLINILNLRHIFYPIAGKNAQDVVTYLIPTELIGKNPIYKLIYSIFLGTDIKGNLMDFSETAYLLYDERIGAFGNMFGKLVVLSGLVYLGSFIYVLKKKIAISLPYLLAFLGLTISILANYQNIWWFRYAPQIWLYIGIAIWILAKCQFKWSSLLLCGLIVFQSYHIFNNTYETDYAKSRSIEEFYQEYFDKTITVQIKSNDLSDIYWFDAYEQARAKQEGVNLVIVHDQEVLNPKKCHFMHSYKICPVE